MNLLKYDCPICKDMKYLLKPDGKTPWGAVEVPCPNGCADQITMGRLTSVCGLEGEEFNISLGGKWNPHMRAAAQSAFNAVKQGNGVVVLLGPNGCGKTHILMGAVNMAMRSNMPAMWTRTESLMKRFGKAVGDGDFASVYALVEGVKVLALDEVGRQNNTDWATARLFELLDDRIARKRGDLLTLIASNLHLEDLDDYLKSRVLASDISLHQLWKAPDIRPVKDKGV